MGADPVRETQAMIAAMDPVLRDGVFVFCSFSDKELAARADPLALARFEEVEGTSLLLPVQAAEELGFPTDLAMRQITLQVTSALDGVGLTAAVADRLTKANIPCNVIAAMHHDHVFVPVAMAERAVTVLQALAADARA